MVSGITAQSESLTEMECQMRRVRESRHLSNAEVLYATVVFQSSLPPWSQIWITDGLGPIPGYDNPYTDKVITSGHYAINVGPDVYPDTTQNKSLSGFGKYRDIFIHEMTHVWQYYHGYAVVTGSMWANTFGKGYDYTIEWSDSWDSYNVEQQAHLVEDWFAKGMSKSDKRFLFIENIIREGINAGHWWTRAKLWEFDPEQVPVVKPLQAATLPEEGLYKPGDDPFFILMPILRPAYHISDEKRWRGQIDDFAVAMRKIRSDPKYSGVFKPQLILKLEQLRKGDPLSELFYYRFETSVRADLVRILKGEKP
jgi:hypothetical protein